MIDAPVTPDPEAAIGFLELLRPSGPWVLTAITPDGPATTETFFKAEAVARWIERENTNRNIYVMVAEPIGALRKKATKGDVARTRNLWADVDGDGDLRGRLNGHVPPPTMTVASGGGLNLYWALEQPIGDAIEIEARNRWLSDNLEADHCWNADRVLRLAGTINWPNRKKKANGRVPVLARLTEHHPDHVYGLDAFGRIEATEANNGKSADLGDDIQLLTLDDLPAELRKRLTATARRLIKEGPQPDEYRDDRSKAVWAVVASLVRADASDAQIAGILLNPKLPIHAHVRDQKGHGPRAYVARQIERARERVEAPEAEPETGQKASADDAGDGEGACKKKPHPIVRVARAAMTAWGRPLITVDGELWTYANGVWRMFDPALEHSLRTCIQSACETLGLAPDSKTLNGAYRWIDERAELVRAGVQWDRAGIIVGENGALDMATGRVGPQRQEHYATRAVACSIDLAATCPVWMDFLKQSLPAGGAGTLQEWFGAAMVRGKTRETTKGLIVYGPSRTGKTQITEVIRALLGGGTCGLRVRSMSERFGMQPLLTASGWVADDAVGMREVMDAEAYKIVVTGESVSVERKNRTNVEAAFDLPVLLTMNNYPIVKDDSDAVYNRTLVLPMTREWSDEEAKPIAKQVVANELSGVLNWALEGWKRLKARRRFDPSASMLAAGKDFKSQNNPMSDFLELCVENDANFYVMAEDIRRIFNNWLRREIVVKDGWSAKAIGLTLQKSSAKPLQDKVHAGRAWVGIKFTEAALAFDDYPFGQAAPMRAEERAKALDALNKRVHPELYAKHREELGRRLKEQDKRDGAGPTGKGKF
jgi:P4 family phage/plasmid primase-like protien